MLSRFIIQLNIVIVNFIESFDILHLYLSDTSCDLSHIVTK